MAATQQGNETYDPIAAPPMSMAVAANEPTDSRKSLVDRLSLKTFEAAGDLSLCADDKVCLKDAQEIKSWRCAAGVCDGTDKSKEPTACFKGFFGKYSIEVIDQIDASICPFIKSPSTVTRQALLSHIPNGDEDYLVDAGVYLLALKGSAVSCENYIKNYVGPYGPAWNAHWYKYMSGCRILAKKRTREEEEKDFSAWLLGNCLNIIDIEMRKACSAPGSSFPDVTPGK